MRPNAAPILLALCGPLVLSGCDGTVFLATSAVTAASFATTEKLPTDHIASWVTGEDCSSLEMERTGKFCRTEAEIAADELANQPEVAMPVFCYRTLGEADCYTDPEPGQDERLVR
ncbi:MAG: hypothetical protein AB7F08_09030 [Dongiaceae bacterium]